VDVQAGELRIDGRVFRAGDEIGVDGTDGAVVEPGARLLQPAIDERFERILEWSDEIRRLRVRANADSPRDARRARELGAGGIGLCRTEHMVLTEDRTSEMRAMIIAEDSVGL